MSFNTAAVNHSQPAEHNQSSNKPTLAKIAHHAITGLGIAALIALFMMFVKPELLDKFRELSPFASQEEVDDAEPVPPSLAMLMQAPNQSHDTVAANATEEDAKMLGNQRQQQWVTNWLAKRYRVAGEATNLLVSAAYLTAKEIKLDPLLILSVMAIESGLNPFAESPMGAQGLMQVMSKLHHDKFQELGGVKAALNPVANIKVGAQILKDYVSRAGSVEAGLKMYVGAAASESDAGYGSRVMTEYKRLKDVSAGKRVPTVFAAPPAPAKPTTNEAKAPTGKSATQEQVAAL